MMIFTQPADRKMSLRIYEDITPTLRSAMGSGGGNVPMVLGVGIKEGIVGTLDASYFKGPSARGGIERTMVSQSVRVLNPSDSQGNQVHDGEVDAYATLRGCGGAGY